MSAAPGKNRPGIYTRVGAPAISSKIARFADEIEDSLGITAGLKKAVVGGSSQTDGCVAATTNASKLINRALKAKKQLKRANKAVKRARSRSAFRLRKAEEGETEGATEVQRPRRQANAAYDRYASVCNVS